MNNIKIFENPEFGKVRVVEVEGEPWFVGKDVAAVLGYRDTDQALRKRVDEEDKLTRQFDGAGQGRNMIIVNESGLYSLILSSKLPTAKMFKKWVTAEVLPTIRKTGGYVASADLMVETYFGGMNDARKQLVKGLLVNIENQQKTISVLQPKARYYDLILNNKEVLPITVIAKDYGMTAQQLNAKLAELGVQYKRGKIWYLYEQYAGEGYTQARTYQNDEMDISATRTYWTRKGRRFIYDMLKGEGILPLIEVA